MCVPLVSRPNGLVSPLITDLPTKSKQVEAIITVIHVCVEMMTIIRFWTSQT